MTRQELAESIREIEQLIILISKANNKNEKHALLKKLLAALCALLRRLVKILEGYIRDILDCSEDPLELASPLNFREFIEADPDLSAIYFGEEMDRLIDIATQGYHLLVGPKAEWSAECYAKALKNYQQSALEDSMDAKELIQAFTHLRNKVCDKHIDPPFNFPYNKVGLLLAIIGMIWGGSDSQPPETDPLTIPPPPIVAPVDSPQNRTIQLFLLGVMANIAREITGELGNPGPRTGVSPPPISGRDTMARGRRTPPPAPEHGESAGGQALGPTDIQAD